MLVMIEVAMRTSATIMAPTMVRFANDQED